MKKSCGCTAFSFGLNIEIGGTIKNNHMKKSTQNTLMSIVGVVGTIACVAIFIKEPSFPTPDKLLVFLTFVFMIFNQAWDMLKRFVPFVAILLVYDSFRGIVPMLHGRVNYEFMAEFDIFLFGGTLPTITLQNWFFQGHAVWHDYYLYIVYMMHFVLPLGLAVAIYKLREKEYWRYATTYTIASFTAFFIYIIYPAAPPWIATSNGTIPHVERISSEVYRGLGITNFPSVYNSIAPNPVAAVPSLHVGYAVLFSIFAFELFGRRWGSLSLIYPLSMCFGVVYMGEHYVFDVVTGALLAAAAYIAAPYVLSWFLVQVARIRGRTEGLKLRRLPNKT